MKSSLELFAIALYEGGYLQGNGDEIEKLLNRFKEIEKEQIKSAFNIGELMAHDYFYGNDDCAENYYKETYGGKNESK
jgi:hypothetical protein